MKIKNHVKIGVPFVVLFLIAAFLSTHAAAQVTVTGSSRQITTNPAGQFNPAISGNIVVYTDLRNGNLDVYYTDLSTSTETQVTNATGTDEDELADVSGNTIVYVDFSGSSSNVLGYSIGGAPLNSFDISQNGSSSQGTNPGIGGSLVAWQDNRNGNWDIYAQDLSTSPPTTKRITANTLGNSYSPNATGRLIAYTTALSTTSCQVFVTNFDTLTTTQLTSTPGCNQSVDISGNRVVYVADRTGSGNPQLYVYDLTTNTETQATAGGYQQNPHISGDWVAFESVASGATSINLYNIPSGSTFTAVPGTSPSDSAFLNDIDGTNIAYTSNVSGVDHIYVYSFTFTNSYTAAIQPPISADGTSVFAARRGVVPVKFTLAQNGAPTCQLPSATIALTRTAGGTPGSVDESVYSMAADSGSNFRIDSASCEYVYNLAASSLGAGTYAVEILIDGAVVGTATFSLK